MHTKLYIAGEDIDGAKQAIRLNPVSGAAATVYAAAGVSEADAAAKAAGRAFEPWSKTGIGVRRAILNKAADELEARQGDIVEAIVAETGATKGWAGFNVMVGAGMFREAAAMVSQVTGEVIPSNRPGTTALAVRQPVGAMLGIAPWNAPIILGARAIAMPLACGNSMVFKGSELCPRTHRFVIDALHSAGVPEGVVNYINNDPDDAPAVVEALVTHPAIKRINFTGSTKVGKIIAGLAARDLKPVLLELGGKAPMVVLNDANIEEAVKGATFGAFFNQGQICMSTERIILDDAIADRFVSAFAERVKKLLAADPSSADAPLGAVVTMRTAEHLTFLLDDAAAKGAEIVHRGEMQGTVIQPSIVDKVTANMHVWNDESFGPIVAIARASGDKELVRLANDTDYGLSASVYGSDVSRLMQVATAIQSGICHINAPTVYDEPQMPFGGVKSSGYGRFGGWFSLGEFTEVRWLTINSLPVHLPF